ncbi:putative lipo protein [Lineolata rhizophorae]|uniref:Putative lipo protein n=1 Tax=Lineolata rhizophorae TaxID=578093 RepID=A0A6A6NTY2_9PEZI|nr:putative lipo protein [Lineolata rhizophorae]
MLFLNGFHFISGQPDAYIHANHHCSIMNADFIQCAIYVPGTNPARLAGIEYIVSGALFSTFPHEERQLWHSHQFEVTSGYLTEPGTPEIVDHEIMKILVNSYGKTVHTWRYDQKDNDVPLGIPEFVNGYTGDGQLPQWFVDDRDELMNVNTTATRIAREDIEPPPVQEGADSWKYGYVITYGIVNTTTDTTFDGVD